MLLQVTFALTSKCHITHVSGALFVPHASLHIKQCAPWPVGGSVWCVNYMRRDPVHFCHTAEVWTPPLTLGLLSTAPPLEWTTTVCQKITTHLTGTHTRSSLHLCTVDACTCAGMHEQMLTSASGVLMTRHAGRCLCTHIFVHDTICF